MLKSCHLCGLFRLHFSKTSSRNPLFSNSRSQMERDSWLEKGISNNRSPNLRIDDCPRDCDSLTDPLLPSWQGRRGDLTPEQQEILTAEFYLRNNSTTEDVLQHLLAKSSVEQQVTPAPVPELSIFVGLPSALILQPSYCANFFVPLEFLGRCVLYASNCSTSCTLYRSAVCPAQLLPCILLLYLLIAHKGPQEVT